MMKRSSGGGLFVWVYLFVDVLSEPMNDYYFRLSKIKIGMKFQPRKGRRQSDTAMYL